MVNPVDARNAFHSAFDLVNSVRDMNRFGTSMGRLRETTERIVETFGKGTEGAIDATINAVKNGTKAPFSPDNIHTLLLNLKNAGEVNGMAAISSSVRGFFNLDAVPRNLSAVQTAAEHAGQALAHLV